MKMIARFTILAACAFVMFSGACKSLAEYQHDAVIRARSYALRKFPDLTEKQRHHVAYAKPQILQKRVFIRGGESESRQDVVHTCIVWKLPDTEEECMVVVGVSERRLDDWAPIRAVIRKYENVESEFSEIK